MINNFNDLLNSAKEQTNPQRLLLMFAKAQADDEKLKGGLITPTLCIDKLPEEISSFKDLIAEADSVSSEWDFIFVGGLSGQNNAVPSSEEAEPHLTRMTEQLATGEGLAQYLVFNRKEQLISIHPA